MLSGRHPAGRCGAGDWGPALGGRRVSRSPKCASSSSAASLWSVTYEVRSLPRLLASWNLHHFDAAIDR